MKICNLSDMNWKRLGFFRISPYCYIFDISAEQTIAVMIHRDYEADITVCYDFNRNILPKKLEDVYYQNPEKSHIKILNNGDVAETISDIEDLDRFFAIVEKLVGKNLSDCIFNQNRELFYKDVYEQCVKTFVGGFEEYEK